MVAIIFPSGSKLYIVDAKPPRLAPTQLSRMRHNRSWA
jgi:hypothetical protein